MSEGAVQHGGPEHGDAHCCADVDAHSCADFDVRAPYQAHCGPTGTLRAHGYTCTGMDDCRTHITALYAHAPAHKQSWAPKPHHSWSHLRHGRAGTVPMLVHSCAGTEAHLRCD